MSIADTKQNLNENHYRPDYGTDGNGIQYSCGHINPLQRALVNNGVEKLNSIKNNLEDAINSINDFTTEILDFAKNRCEEIREVNRELRSALDNYECSCLDYYECENCNDLENEKSELNDKINEMQAVINEKETLLNETKNALEKMQKKFEMVKDLVENLEEL